MDKINLLKEKIEHIDISKFDSTPIINAMSKMSFTARECANAAELLEKMVEDDKCTIILTIAGSTSAGGCMKIYSDMVKYNIADAVVATGASIVDMDFFEALGFNHYKGTCDIDDKKLRKLYIDRIYDTFINEKDLQKCDKTIKEIADNLIPKPYSSREFIKEMGRYLFENSRKKDSLVQIAYEKNIPIFCPAFSDSSAGFGIVKHQWDTTTNNVSIDSAKDFMELTQIKINSPVSGLFMVGGGVPKNFAQDTVVCSEILGYKETPLHKYAVQITVADVRDGACSSSTLKEASSWGKVDAQNSQMVYSEATLALPLIASYVYHKRMWEKRKPKELSKMFE